MIQLRCTLSLLLKCELRLDIRKYNFSVRSIKLWNSLPQSVVDSEDIKSFEIALDEFWDDQELKYDKFDTDIRIVTNRRLAEYQV